MAKHHPVVLQLQAAMLRAMLGVLWRLPDRVAVAGTRRLGRFASFVMRSRTRIATERVQECLGLEAPEARRIARGSFEAMALNSIEPELLRRRLSHDDLDDHLIIEGREHLDAAVATGRGVVFCSGHFGAWEVFPTLIARLGHPIWFMKREASNPYVEAWVAERVRIGEMRGVVSKDGGIPTLAKALRRGEPVGMLLDQRARKHGVVLPFLGRPASHFKTAGVLAQRFGAVLMPFYVFRERPADADDWAYRIVFEEPIVAPEDGEAGDIEIELTHRVSQSLERRVRETPDQWLWLHDRWKGAKHGQPTRFVEVPA